MADNTTTTLLGPDSGDGSPALVDSPTPVTQGTATPPFGPPYRKGTELTGVCTETQTDVSSFSVSASFSTKTCLELLPTLTPAQLDFEIKYLKYINSNFKSRSSTDNGKLISIKTFLTQNLISDFDAVLQKYDSLIKTISCTLETTRRDIDELVSSTTNRLLPTPPTVHCPTIPESASSPGKLPEPVCNLNVNFDELYLDSILHQLDISNTATCNRKTAYFGDKPYTYGRIKHSPAEYIDCDVFNIIFDKLSAIDPDFTRNNYTCLVNYYPDGTSYISPHHDDESMIAEDSIIYTISVGATRVLHFTNTSGPIQEHNIELQHGSVYTMSRESQLYWVHSIKRDPTIKEARISFTFRRLIDAEPAPRSSLPPISPPKLPTLPPTARGTHDRILLLTDSIISNTPTFIFDTVEKHKCVKKINYELANIFNFEQEFKYSDVVIISGGVNDLSRHNHTAHSLADIVCNRLRDCCNKNKGTSFIFNSLLLTKFGWLNSEISEFNRIMFALSETLPNLMFFDSHHTLMASRLGAVIDSRGNGVHIVLDAQRIITRQLVNAVAWIVSLKTGSRVMASRLREWVWPLRPSFERRSHKV